MTARFFVTPDKTANGFVVIEGADAAHISLSLRMRAGEKITVCCGDALIYECELVAMTKTAVTAKIISSRVCESELPVRVHLFQSLPKGDKMELIVQKATELGVYSVTPVLSERCIYRPDASQLEKKLVRYNSVCREAAMQCGRGYVPAVLPAVAFKEALRLVPDGWQKLFCYEGEGTLPIAKALSDNPDIAVFVGPEGGYPDSEAEAAKSSGFTMTGLGRRILRCETAPLFALSCIASRYEAD